MTNQKWGSDKLLRKNQHLNKISSTEELFGKKVKLDQYLRLSLVFKGKKLKIIALNKYRHYFITKEDKNKYF